METYGLIGKKLDHSFSRAYFTQTFEREHRAACYRNFEIESIDLLPRVISENPGLCGLNVTIPYKQQVMAFLDDIDRMADEIGAVNTIAFDGIDPMTGSPRLIGFNTDATGFSRSIAPLLGPDDRRALVLGSGGASRAVVYALRAAGIEPTVVSRTSGADRITYGDLTESIVSDSTVVVNTTPLGTTPDTDSAPPFPYHMLSSRHICHDLVYNPSDTRFMQLCRARGARVKNGYDMLLGQAEASWEIWQRFANRTSRHIR